MFINRITLSEVNNTSRAVSMTNKNGWSNTWTYTCMWAIGGVFTGGFLGSLVGAGMGFLSSFEYLGGLIISTSMDAVSGNRFFNTVLSRNSKKQRTILGNYSAYYPFKQNHKANSGNFPSNTSVIA